MSTSAEARLFQSTKGKTLAESGESWDVEARESKLRGDALDIWEETGEYDLAQLMSFAGLGASRQTNVL